MSDVNFTIVRPEVSYLDFIRLMVDLFPVLAENVLDEFYEDLPHLQVSFLAKYANQCLSDDNFDEFERTVRFFQQMVNKVDSLVENALYVSFLEYLEIGGSSEKCRAARGLLTPEQLKTWVALQQFWGIIPNID